MARMTASISPLLPDRRSMLLADYWRISRKAKQLTPDQLAADIARAEERFRSRLARSPGIIYAEGLPVSERADEIASLIRNHQFDEAILRSLFGETHLVANARTDLFTQLFGDALRHTARGDATRLRVTDQAVAPASCRQRNLR